MVLGCGENNLLNCTAPSAKKGRAPGETLGALRLYISHLEILFRPIYQMTRKLGSAWEVTKEGRRGNHPVLRDRPMGRPIPWDLGGETQPPPLRLQGADTSKAHRTVPGTG